MTEDRSRPLSPDADFAALRRAFEPWTVDAIAERLGERAMAALNRENIAPARAAASTATPDAPTILTRLFLLGEALEIEHVEAAVTAVTAAQLTAWGLTRTEGTSIRAAVDIRPHSTLTPQGEQTMWVASDLTEAVTHAPLAPDHVLGSGGASNTLANLTMRAPVDRVLDLGTGCGIQALHAARHARHIVATDISRRALNFAHFNLTLNGVADKVELREGSMLEPVAAEQFDLVISNPPFVISPPGTPLYEYRAGASAGDAIVRQLVENVGQVLAPGGNAQFLGNWEIHGDQAWSERIEQWLDASAANGVPLDAWVMQRDTLDGAQYAETWLRDAGLTPERDAPAYMDATKAYLDDFDARGVSQIGMGVVLLRRPAAQPTLRRLESFEGALPDAMGEHVSAMLTAHDWLESLPADALLDTAFIVTGDVTEERYAPPGQPDPTHILLRQGGAFGRSFVVDTAIAGLVGVCDGELTLRQIVNALAALLDLDPSELAQGALPRVRELVTDGLLVPASA